MNEHKTYMVCPEHLPILFHSHIFNLKKCFCKKNTKDSEPRTKSYPFLLADFRNFSTFSYTINVIEEAGTFFRRFGVIPL